MAGKASYRMGRIRLGESRSNGGMCLGSLHALQDRLSWRPL